MWSLTNIRKNVNGDGIMNNKAIIGILSMLILVVLASGCTSSSSTNQYSSKDSAGNTMSFDIPDGWIFKDKAPGIVIQGETNKTNFTSVTISKLSADGSSLEDLKHNATYARIGKIVSETNRTVDGVKAYQITTKISGQVVGQLGEGKSFVFVKDGNMYTIEFYTGEKLSKIQQDIDTIVNSFHAT
jgi:outer membrane lipoprotein-sorting protein